LTAEYTLYKLASGKARLDPANVKRSAAFYRCRSMQTPILPKLVLDATNWLLGLPNSNQGQQFEFGIELFLPAAAQRELCLACGVSHIRNKSGHDRSADL